jgi:hypothetical protein
MHGKGRFEYANGDVYEGPFAEDKRHGNGTITESGKQYDALFQKGRLIAYTKPLNGLKGASSLMVINEVVCAKEVEQAQRNGDMEVNAYPHIHASYAYRMPSGNQQVLQVHAYLILIPHTLRHSGMIERERERE